MGLIIRLEDENGFEVGFLPETGLLHPLIPNLDDDHFELLGYVDPYGDTTFNGHQAGILVRDLERVKGRATTEDAVLLLDQIIALASRASGETHFYLKFSGDS
jgi:hypothetical protein